MATDILDFQDVYSIVRGHLNPGRLKMNKTGIVFKSSKTGVMDTIPLDDIEDTKWMRVARGFGIKVTAKNGTEYRYHGFKENEYDRLKELYSGHYNIELTNMELAVKGWNWGSAKFKGNVMTFEVDSKVAFEIPLKDVSSATTGKSEVTIEFHRSDDAKVSLMEMRLFVPTQPDETAEDSVKAFQEKVLAKADVIQATGDAIITFDEVACLTPRGKYAIRVYPTFLQLHGKTYDYKVPHTTLLRLFLLPHQDNRFMFFVIALDPPLRQGQTRYPFLILQFERDEEMSCTLNLTESEIEEKYGNKLSRDMSGAVFEVVSRVFKEICQKKITVPGNFKSKAGTSAITCSYKASTGLLYPLERGFIFVHKPALHVRSEEITSVNFARGSTTGRTFDFEMDLKNGTTVIFSNIPRDEYTPLFDFVNAKNIRIKNKGGPGKGGASSLDNMIDSDGEEDDAYLRRMKREGAERDVNEMYGSDDGSEDDEDYNPDKEKIEDVKEEYDSEVSDSTDSDSDWEGDGAEGNDEEREKRREEKRKAKEAKKESKPRKRKTNDDDGGGKKKRKKKDSNAPKRNLSAYFHYLADHREQIKEENPGIALTEITKKAGEMWAKVEDKTTWEEKAREDKERYERENKEYQAMVKERGDVEEPETPKKKKKKTTSSTSKASSSKSKGTPSKTDNSKFKSAEYVEDDFSSSDDDNEEKKPKETKSKSDSDNDSDKEKSSKKTDKGAAGPSKTESEEDEEDSDADHDSDADVEPSTRSTRSKRADGDEELKELDEKQLVDEEENAEEAKLTDGEDNNDDDKDSGSDDAEDDGDDSD